MEQDKISIVIPCYNAEQYLKECLDSILKQDYLNLQIIVINDGSTDNSLEIAQEYQKKDSRITIHNQTNSGPSRARNVGIELAEGKYIAFIDSDDFIENGMFSNMLSNMQEKNADICMCGYYVGDGKTTFYRNTPENKLLTSEEALRRLLLAKETQNFLCNKIFKTALLEGIRLPEGELYEDIAVFYKLLEKANNIAYIDKTFYYYRQHMGSITKSMTKQKCMQFKSQIEKRNTYLLNNYLNLKKECIYNSIVTSLYVIGELKKLKETKQALQFCEKVEKQAQEIEVQKLLQENLPEKSKQMLQQILWNKEGFCNNE